MKGFTLIEVLISLSIFAYVFLSITVLFFQFSKSVHGTNKCSSFSLILIQKILTESDNVEFDSTSSEIYFDNKTLLSNLNKLYLFKNLEKDNFQKNKLDYQLDSCAVSFRKNSTSTDPLLNPLKCIDFQYKNGIVQTICALK